MVGTKVIENIDDLWMQAHASAAMDSQTDIAGNSHDPWAVIATIRYVMSNLGYEYEDPSRIEIETWLTENNREHEIEYLMEI